MGRTVCLLLLFVPAVAAEALLASVAVSSTCGSCIRDFEKASGCNAWKAGVLGPNNDGWAPQGMTMSIVSTLSPFCMDCKKEAEHYCYARFQTEHTEKVMDPEQLDDAIQKEKDILSKLEAKRSELLDNKQNPQKAIEKAMMEAQEAVKDADLAVHLKNPEAAKEAMEKAMEAFSKTDAPMKIMAANQAGKVTLKQDTTLEQLARVEEATKEAAVEAELPTHAWDATQKLEKAAKAVEQLKIPADKEQATKELNKVKETFKYTFGQTLEESQKRLQDTQGDWINIMNKNQCDTCAEKFTDVCPSFLHAPEKEAFFKIHGSGCKRCQKEVDKHCVKVTMNLKEKELDATCDKCASRFFDEGGCTALIRDGGKFMAKSMAVSIAHRTERTVSQACTSCYGALKSRCSSVVMFGKVGHSAQASHKLKVATDHMCRNCAKAFKAKDGCQALSKDQNGWKFSKGSRALQVALKVVAKHPHCTVCEQEQKDVCGKEFRKPLSAEVFVVNHDKRINACNCMASQLSTSPFPVHRLASADSETTSTKCPALKVHMKNAKMHDAALQRCSHYNLLTTALKSKTNAEYIVLMEDDAVIQLKSTNEEDKTGLFWTELQKVIDGGCKFDYLQVRSEYEGGEQKDLTQQCFDHKIYSLKYQGKVFNAKHFNQARSKESVHVYKTSAVWDVLRLMEKDGTKGIQSLDLLFQDSERVQPHVWHTNLVHSKSQGYSSSDASCKATKKVAFLSKEKSHHKAAFVCANPEKVTAV